MWSEDHSINQTLKQQGRLVGSMVPYGTHEKQLSQVREVGRDIVAEGFPMWSHTLGIVPTLPNHILCLQSKVRSK